MNRWVSSGSPQRATCVSGACPDREMVAHPCTSPFPISSVGTSTTMTAMWRVANRLAWFWNAPGVYLPWAKAASYASRAVPSPANTSRVTPA